ncbi:protrudin isoform X1 [Acomys russatus]|uniref:protrudin isoform X1 n=1 Tax=Acomys russatus TaxID=60746 RepID=UPI0021E1D779|nr:protrudin isoform X1 [Acomys russatus]
MQTSDRDLSGPEGSPSMMSEVLSECSPAPTKSTAFDLFNLVLSYKRLEVYLEPLKDAGDGVRFLLRWQMPLCSLLTCLGLNILFLTLNEGAWYSMGALMISVPALLGYLQEVCRAQLPESELMRRKYHSTRQEDLQRVRLSRPEAVAEVKSFLIQLEAVLSRLCCTCETAYRVLHWENPVVSSQFYGALLGMVCMLYLLPLCWVLALLNSTLFLGNMEFFRVVSEYRACLQRRMNPKQEEYACASSALQDSGGRAPLLDSTPAPTPTEDLTPGSVEEAEEAEPDEEFKDAIEVGGLLPIPLLTRPDVGGLRSVCVCVFLTSTWEARTHRARIHRLKECHWPLPSPFICPECSGRAGSAGLCKPLLGVGGLSPGLGFMMSEAHLEEALPVPPFLDTKVHRCPFGRVGNVVAWPSASSGKV